MSPQLFLCLSNNWELVTRNWELVIGNSLASADVSGIISRSPLAKSLMFLPVAFARFSRHIIAPFLYLVLHILNIVLLNIVLLNIVLLNIVLLNIVLLNIVLLRVAKNLKIVSF